MNLLLRPPLSLYHITILVCLGCMLIDHVNSQTIGSSNISCIDGERRALVNFKKSLVLHSKRNLSDWSHENMDCCRWEGIRCSKAGRVVAMDLHCPWNFLEDYDCLAGIGGEISSSLLQLSYLNYLDLSNNYFTKVPEFVGSLKRLRYLNLSHNPLIGKVPHQLGNLSVLETLDLGYDDFGLEVDSLAWVSRLTSLEYLDLSEVRLSSAQDWLQSISKLPYLASLYLRYNDLPIPPPIQINGSISLEVVHFSGLSNLNLIDLYPLLNASTKLVDLSISGVGFLTPFFLDYLTKLVSIKYLDLSRNDIEGVLPETFTNLSNLVTLDVSWNRLNKSFGFLQSGSNSLQELLVNHNQLQEPLPNISKFPSLQVLNLARNNFTGSLAQVLQHSSNLIELDVSSNHFSGTLTEAHFRNINNLQVLSLSSNSLTLSFSVGFTPPFQLQKLILGGCKLGKIFPHWLRTQKNLTILDISNSGISDTVPSWFWNISSQLTYLNVSHNSMSGSLPPNSLSTCDYVDLRSNRFHGTLPSFSKTLWHLDVSDNSFSGGITSLSGLKGTLLYLDLSNNKFTGSLPNSIGSLRYLQVMRLRNNSFSGKLPQSLKNCTRLNILDLGENHFSGTVPDWIGTSLPNLSVLRLRSNKFKGNIPSSLCRLNLLQILDLSINHLSGTIPSCLDQLENMKDQLENIIEMNYSLIHRLIGSFIIENRLDGYSTSVFWKGLQMEYKNVKGMEILRYIDLSSNILSGSIPEELASLIELDVLRLSHNVLIGPIPNKFGQLKMLETLDLSHNLISGEIPSSMADMTTLSYLDLSYNNLTGRIPISTQLSTINASMFMGNQGLCGAPLSTSCHGDTVETHSPNTEGEGGDGDENMWMYISIALGFIVGFWGVCGTLLLKNSWAQKYFQFLTYIVERLHVAILIRFANLRRRFTG